MTARMLYRYQDDAWLLEGVRETNAGYMNWSVGQHKMQGVIRRWNVEKKLIPVSTGGDTRAEEALAIVEFALGRKLFERCGEGDVTAENPGLIFSRETAAPAKLPVTKACKGSVSVAPGCRNLPVDLSDPLEGFFRRILYVNLDGPQPEGGIADVEIAVHELGHALGMGKEFRGFGGGSPVSLRFWYVLRKLYELPILSRP